MRSAVSLMLGVTLAAAVVLPAQAQWKWRDARGQVHMSDLPPPREVPEKDILQRADLTPRRALPAAQQPSAAASGASAVAGADKPRVDPELEARRKKTEAEAAEKKKAEDDKLNAARAENCQRARSQLATLESGMRMARVNKDGEREILDDKARADEVQRTKQIIATDCK